MKCDGSGLRERRSGQGYGYGYSISTESEYRDRARSDSLPDVLLDFPVATLSIPIHIMQSHSPHVTHRLSMLHLTEPFVEIITYGPGPSQSESFYSHEEGKLQGK